MIPTRLFYCVDDLYKYLLAAPSSSKTSSCAMVTEQGIQGTTIALTHIEHVIGEVDSGYDGTIHVLVFWWLISA